MKFCVRNTEYESASPIPARYGRKEKVKVAPKWGHKSRCGAKPTADLDSG